RLPLNLISGEVFGRLGQQTVLPTFLAEDLLPEVLGIGIENEWYRSRVGKPGFALNFVLELARAPAGVPGEHFDLPGRRKGFADFDQVVQRVTQVQIRQNVGIGNESITVQETQCGRLNGSTEVKWTALKRVWEVGDEHITGVVARCAVEHESEGTFRIMLTDEHDSPLEKRSV